VGGCWWGGGCGGFGVGVGWGGGSQRGRVCVRTGPTLAEAEVWVSCGWCGQTSLQPFFRAPHQTYVRGAEGPSFVCCFRLTSLFRSFPEDFSRTLPFFLIPLTYTSGRGHPKRPCPWCPGKFAVSLFCKLLLSPLWVFFFQSQACLWVEKYTIISLGRAICFLTLPLLRS